MKGLATLRTSCTAAMLCTGFPDLSAVASLVTFCDVLTSVHIRSNEHESKHPLGWLDFEPLFRSFRLQKTFSPEKASFHEKNVCFLKKKHVS